jgi:hypothetical protein
MVDGSGNRLALTATLLNCEGKVSRWSGIQQPKRARYEILRLTAVGYAKFYSRSRNAVIRVYDAAGNVIETHEHAGEFKEP